MKIIISLFCILCCSILNAQEKIQIGAFYFDGWAGHRNSIEEWAKNAPTHLSYKLMTKFAEREPIWGWRDDNIDIMEKQIDIAAENGIDFFIFCWYYTPNKGKFDKEKTEQLHLNTALSLFLKARNKNKIKFSIIICNHKGFEIEGKNNWIKAINYLSEKYFQDPQYLKFNNKPVISIFGSNAFIPYIKTIRNEYKKNSLNDLFIVSNHSMNNQFDAHSWYNIKEREPGHKEERKYLQLTKNAEYIWHKYENNSNVIPLVMAGWDQRPWEIEEKKLYYTGKKPKYFKQHLQNAINYVKNNKSCKVKYVFIYAWNEYGEGSWLAPTKGDKKGKFLRTIKKVNKNL